MNIYNFYKNNNNNFYYSEVLINKFMLRVYAWMSLGLIITSLISWIISNHIFILNFILCNQIFILLSIITQFIIIFLISNYIEKLEENTITSLFIFYSILTGINLSTIFIVYTSFEIFISFFTTSITFILMTLYGYFTKNNLTSFGNLLFMLLIGIILSSITNLYLKSNFLIWIISYLSILVFTGLIAYDTQKLKNLGNNLYYKSEINNNFNLLNKYSILGALILYLDFINLFLIPLKIIGNNKKNKN